MFAAKRAAGDPPMHACSQSSFCAPKETPVAGRAAPIACAVILTCLSVWDIKVAIAALAKPFDWMRRDLTNTNEGQYAWQSLDDCRDGGLRG